MKLRGETGTGFMTQSQRSSSSNRGLRVAHLQDASKLHENIVRWFGPRLRRLSQMT